MGRTNQTLQKMLLTLSDNSSFVTLDQLSQELEISKRSVQNYLSKAELWLRDHDLAEVSIIKKQGNGILLKASDTDRQKLASLLSSQYFTSLDGSADRRIEILRSLVFSQDELTIQFLADKFYVSRFIIQSDLDWVENWLAQYNLKLYRTQRRGIGIAGSEFLRRSAIAGFFDMQKHREPVAGHPTKIAVRLAKERLQNLEEVYNEEDICKVCAIIEEAEKTFNFYMGSDFFTGLATHITISVFRLRHGYQIKKEFLPPDGEFPHMEMNTAHFIASRLEDTFHIKLPELERIYICIHLMSYHAFQAQEDKQYNVPKNIEALTLHLIEGVDADLGGDFSSDKMLFFGLLHHIRNVIYFLRENPNSRPSSSEGLPPLNEAGKEILASVQKHIHAYREFCGVEPDKRELLCVTLHFVLSAARTTHRKRALLVSNSGILVQQKLLREFQEDLPQIKIVDVCSTNQFSFCPEGMYDFVISAIPLETAQKPVVLVAHMSREERTHTVEDFVFTKLDS